MIGDCNKRIAFSACYIKQNVAILINNVIAFTLVEVDEFVDLLSN